MGQAGIIINLILMILNIIPIPPLDGSRIVSSFLPGKMDYQYSRMEPYGFIILLILLATGILGKIIGPVLTYCMQLVLILFGIR
jgi:Zn-dependent protease